MSNDHISIQILFDVGDYNIPYKVYNVEVTETVRSMVRHLLNDLQNSKIDIPQEEKINYGLALVDSNHRFVRFLSDHTFLGVVSEPNGISVEKCLLLSFKKKMIYHNIVSRKGVEKSNKKSVQLKFVKALISENIDSVSKFLEAGLDPNFWTGINETPLTVWCSINPLYQEPMLKLLIKFGIHLDLRSPFGHCAIHRAISQGNINAIRLLYLNGSLFEEWDDEGTPALFYAVDCDSHPCCLEFILDLHANYAICDSSGNNAIHYCCKKGLANHLSIFISKCKKTLSSSEFVSVLTAKNNCGNTPTHIAVLEKQLGCLELLSRYSFCLKVPNKSKDTPVDLAKRTRDISVMGIFERFQTKTETSFYGTLSKDTNLAMSPASELFDNASHYSSISRSMTKRSRHTRVLSNHGYSQYPPKFIAVCDYTRSSSEELSVKKGEVVYVYLVLSTCVMFVHKEDQGRRVYGWMPSTSIGLFVMKKVLEFQRHAVTLENLSTRLPLTYENNACDFVPVSILVKLSPGEKSVGINISCRLLRETKKSRGTSIVVGSSPFYVREILSNSPAERCGIRIGDQLAFIMSSDVSSMSVKEVGVFIKSLTSSKLPSGLPSNSFRNIFFTVIRHNDSVSARNDDFFCSQDLCTDLNSVNTFSTTYDVAGSTSADCSSPLTHGEWPVMSNTKQTAPSDSRSLSLRNKKHTAPLPPLPVPSHCDKGNENAWQLKENKPDANDSQLSIDKVPLPPQDLLLYQM